MQYDILWVVAAAGVACTSGSNADTPTSDTTSTTSTTASGSGATSTTTLGVEASDVSTDTSTSSAVSESGEGSTTTLGSADGSSGSEGGTSSPTDSGESTAGDAPPDAVGMPWQRSLGRALVAVPHAEGVLLSWRLLADDPDAIAFHVYRTDPGQEEPTRLTAEPLSDRTNYLALGASLDAEFYVTAVVDGAESSPSEPAWSADTPGHPRLTIPTEGIDTHARYWGIGDLRGSGQLDFVLKYPGTNIDPYHSIWQPSTTRYELTAVSRDGEVLWTYPMGRAIEPGIWYSPYLVHDLDLDGKAEVIVKAGDETLTDDELQDETGRVVAGRELVRVLRGEDGATILAEAPWPDRRGYRGADPPGTPLEDREYEDYNRWSRNLLAIAHLDGVHPHIIVFRGTYGKLKVVAYRYQDETLHQAWAWENLDPDTLEAVEPGDAGYEEYRSEYEERQRWWGQGAHSIRVGDIDDDGRDEVILGAIALDDDGTPLWSFDRGHVDHVHLGELDPQREGLELYFGTERGHSSMGMGMVDPSSGALLWGNDWATSHIHREGMCADIDASVPGTECYSGENDRSGHWLFDAQGNVLATEAIYDSLNPKVAYWDGDPQRELLAPSGASDDLLMHQPNDPESGELFPFLELPSDVPTDDRQWARILGVVDLVGDWREEVIVADRSRLLVYTSNVQAPTRRVWLMQDPVYRMGVSVSSMGYYQQPLLSYDMATTPAP